MFWVFYQIESLLKPSIRNLEKSIPTMQSFIYKPHYVVRSSKYQLVDIDGDSVARANLRGADFLRSHNVLELINKGIFNKSD